MRHFNATVAGRTGRTAALLRNCGRGRTVVRNSHPQTSGQLTGGYHLCSATEIGSAAATNLLGQHRSFRIVTLGVDTPEEIAARKAAEKAEKRMLATHKGGSYLPKPDQMLTNFPDGVGSCTVFRNVMSSNEEQLIWEELMPVMKQDGTLHFAEATKVDEKRLRNIYLEMYGMKPYTDINNWKKQETKQVPGFVWTPTLVKWLQKVGPEIEAFLNSQGSVRLTPLPPSSPVFGGLGGDNVGNAKQDGKKGLNTSPVEGPVHWLDMGRIVEHNDPGYEMHTEHPTTGRYFIYLNLLSETVLTFDDEATGRVGKVLLPQRSLMVCSSELRWGWRVGEHSQRTQIFEKPTSVVASDGTVQPSMFKKTVTPDIRLSIQLWKYDAKLADRRHLQSQVESSVRSSLGGDMYAGYEGSSSEGDSNSAAGSSGGALGGSGLGGDGGGAFKIDAFALGKDDKAKEIKRGGGSSPLNMTKTTAPDINDANNSVGLGKLGGDLITQAERDAAAKASSSSSSSTGGGPDAVTVPKTMTQIDKDFSKYKDSFTRLTGVMSDIKAREDAGMKVSDEWLKEKMNFEKEGDEYGFDPANPERTWEQIENKARFYRDRIKSMDYDGTNEIGGSLKKKKKTSATTTTTPGGGVARDDANTQRAARDSLEAELIIEGIEEDLTQAQKRQDDDEEGDGLIGDKYSGFGNPNRTPADMRAMMEKILPREKADRMLGSLPKSLGGGAAPGTAGSGPFGGSGNGR